MINIIKCILVKIHKMICRKKVEEEEEEMNEKEPQVEEKEEEEEKSEKQKTRSMLVILPVGSKQLRKG